MEVTCSPKIGLRKSRENKQDEPLKERLESRKKGFGGTVQQSVCFSSFFDHQYA